MIRKHINRHATNLFEGKDSIRIDDRAQTISYPAHSEPQVEATMSNLKLRTNR